MVIMVSVFAGAIILLTLARSVRHHADELEWLAQERCREDAALTFHIPDGQDKGAE